MASLPIAIGKSAIRSLGKAYEKENYQYYLDKKLEDGVLHIKLLWIWIYTITK